MTPINLEQDGPLKCYESTWARAVASEPLCDFRTDHHYCQPNPGNNAHVVGNGKATWACEVEKWWSAEESESELPSSIRLHTNGEKPEPGKAGHDRNAAQCYMYIILLMPEHKKRTHAQTSLFFAAQTSWASSWCVMEAVLWLLQPAQNDEVRI
jgi:hypothetical protein